MTIRFMSRRRHGQWRLHSITRTIDLELHNLIASTGKEDELMKNTKTALQNKQSLPLNSHPFDWRIEGNLLFYKDKCYVPDNLEEQHSYTTIWKQQDTQDNYEHKN